MTGVLLLGAGVSFLFFLSFCGCCAAAWEAAPSRSATQSRNPVAVRHARLFFGRATCVIRDSSLVGFIRGRITCGFRAQEAGVFWISHTATRRGGLDECSPPEARLMPRISEPLANR